ncbi:MAG: S41 family peptidase [bacterium]
MQKNYYRPVEEESLLKGAVREMAASYPRLGKDTLLSPGEGSLTWENFTFRFSALAERYPEEAGGLGEAAIRGIIEGLGDPYSVFLDARSRKNFENETTGGSFPGIGVELAIKDGRLLIVAAIQGTPAFKAGLRPGDEMVAIDGKNVRSLNFSKAMSLLDGAAGTPLSLTLRRGDSVQAVRLTRENLCFPPPAFRMMRGGIGYISIPLVDRSTEERVQEGLDSLKGRGAGKFILDLRNNPGGDFEGGMRVASLFVPDGTLIKVRKGGQVKPVYARRPFRFGLPLVVLVNGGSASAAEVIAAAISENKAGILVGSRTFGKGLVQTVFSLTGGAAIKITTAEYLTPLGKNLNGVGLAPDISVPDSISPGEDRPLMKAYDYLKKQKIPD